MNAVIKQLLEGNVGNHILPFFWQHGEDEDTLREYMRVIHEANCGAVCVESRPHPDFCGPKWWTDLDVILEEARKYGMKVWILDDSHFPTGFANGAVKEAPDCLCRQNIFCNSAPLTENQISLREAGLLDPPKQELTGAMAAFMKPQKSRSFEDDEILSVIVSNVDGQRIDVSEFVKNEVLEWERPQGEWELSVCVVSRNTGYHRDYINMLSSDSCHLLIDAVYEKHWQHYAPEFGKTIAGFFSDEPELGNGFLYEQENMLGTPNTKDLPWSAKLQEEFAKRLGESWREKLPLLWQEGEPEETARVRYAYMDLLTDLVRKNFSYQIGDWCRSHGVSYIGHVIEDNGQHCRTGSSLGHYFRGLEGQDMAGIDDIGGQVLPQGEDEPVQNQYRQPRKGEFYHYGLAALARSAAAIEPSKQGRAMCEIFGNYGWQEGVHLEKYLADHFLVRGINYFVPHAFSGKVFPDPDCPPHFYAHGHNPQYRHFGALMKYMNRVADITGSGRHHVPAAVLYHGEAEWCDREAMPFEKPLRCLYDRQIDCHTLPSDIFANTNFYHTELGSTLKVNGQEYDVLVVPAARYLTKAAAEGIAELRKNGMPVFFIDRYPEALCDSKEQMPNGIAKCRLTGLARLADEVEKLNIARPQMTPASDRLRILQMEGAEPVFFLVNEAAVVYKGSVALPVSGPCYEYDAWENCCRRVQSHTAEGKTVVEVKIEPLKSCMLVMGDCDVALKEPITAVWRKSSQKPAAAAWEEVLLEPWKRSVCEGAAYPEFEGEKNVTLPDALAEEQPEFSGYVRYETSFVLEEQPRELVLELTDAAEGVEVFVNGQSAGLQIAPPYLYSVAELAKKGSNSLAIEVATTLERECYQTLEGYRRLLAPVPSAKSGITGLVKLYHR